MTHPQTSRPVSTELPDHAAGEALRAARDAALAALLERAARGNTTAFEAFYDQTLPYAQALARRMLRLCDQADVLSDAYFQAWRELGRFDPGRGSAVTWLLLLVRSRALDQLRHARAQARTMEQASSTDEPEALPSDAPGPPDLIAAAEAGSRVRCALEQLGSQERWVLGLAYYRDLSHSQIAGETGLPLGTVKSLILRAQARLRKMLVQPESFQP